MANVKESFLNRELSWLAFARRVLAMVERRDLPLMERVRFAGIMGMLHDEFFMKRMSGLKRQIQNRSQKTALDGRTPAEEFAACRKELIEQKRILSRILDEELRPALQQAGLPLMEHRTLTPEQQQAVRSLFVDNVQPILTPLAVDAEHPFPFISNGTLNLAILVRDGEHDEPRFVRIKVPDNRPRWVALPDSTGWVPLEQVIAANLDVIFPACPQPEVYLFRVTRGSEGESNPRVEDRDADEQEHPGSAIEMVANDLKARRFAGVVRLEVQETMPDRLCEWLCRNLKIGEDDLYRTSGLLGMKDLAKLPAPKRPELSFAAHEPVTHRRLQKLPDTPQAIFSQIKRGDILLHLPYDSFDSSVLRFIESASTDPATLAIKLTIYRTSKDSPIMRALVDAARHDKQVAVLVEITARFDEAPNIAWGRQLEQEGVHVVYGVEKFKTHVKIALVVREEAGGIRRYVHIGSGNYHPGTARLYEDVGILTCQADLCREVAALFDELTGAMPRQDFRHLLVAPRFMRQRFIELVDREIQNARSGKPCGIQAKMNQLQDPEMIRALYRASQAGVPIELNVRGLCCLRPGVPGLSESIRVFSVVGRFLEHSRIYRFENEGKPEFFIGSADWMKRNLDNRVECITPVLDARTKDQLEKILEVYRSDNSSAWDLQSDGTYVQRSPKQGEKPLSAQDEFIRLAQKTRP